MMQDGSYSTVEEEGTLRSEIVTDKKRERRLMEEIGTRRASQEALSRCPA